MSEESSAIDCMFGTTSLCKTHFNNSCHCAANHCAILIVATYAGQLRQPHKACSLKHVIMVSTLVPIVTYGHVVM